MKTTLVIMAAGIGSRFGTGIKQLEKVDRNNHIIMDYSIHDAIKAGFNKIVFIIRKDIETEFKEVIGHRIEALCKEHDVQVSYAYQSIHEIPFVLPQGRTKPWGTGQAVLAAKELINEPFAVINADDYYGKEPFVLIHEFLCSGEESMCMAGFELENTLSDYGAVTRGICKTADDYLVAIEETRGIIKDAGKIMADGKVIDKDSIASMNMWGFTPEYLKLLEEGFEEFFAGEVSTNPLKAEFLIPTHVGSLLKKGNIRVKALRTDSRWCGMTYKEDIPHVKERFTKMIGCEIYKDDLYSDL